jgi:hydrogenase maturation protease
MTEQEKRVVVLGLGDPFHQDEGVGVHVLRMLADNPWLPDAELLEGSPARLTEISRVDGIDKLVVVDALRSGRTPGSIARVSLKDITEQPSPLLSMNEQLLLDTLSTLRQLGLRVGEIVIFGVEPGQTGWGTDLSEEVAGCLPYLAMRVQREISFSPNEDHII